MDGEARGEFLGHAGNSVAFVGDLVAVLIELLDGRSATSTCQVTCVERVVCQFLEHQAAQLIAIHAGLHFQAIEGGE